MASKEHAIVEITPEVLLKAYACGIFPMAESADDPALYWIEPEARGIIPLAGFRVPGRLARTVRSNAFTVVANRDFDAVLEALHPRLAFNVANRLSDDDSKLAVELRFRSLHDFGPAEVAGQVPPLRRLVELRSELTELLHLVHERRRHLR